MPLTNQQTTDLFTQPDQMGLEARTWAFLTNEGIQFADDMSIFKKKESWKQLLENCKRPPQIADPNNPGQMIDDRPYRIGAKSLMRLRVLAVAVSYYEETARPLSVASVQWDQRLKNFSIEWDAIMELKDSSDQERPKVTKSVGIAQYLEAYVNYSKQDIGARDAPRFYVIREDINVDPNPPPLAPNQPYSTEHGSVMEEMMMRLSHTHPLFKKDSGVIYDDLEFGTRGTKYHVTVISFQKRKDGRGAYLALVAQFTGPALWDSEVEEHMEFLLNRKFTGGTSFTLEQFLQAHRRAHNGLQRASEHVQCQVPDDRTRVGYLITNIVVADQDVKAALAAIKLDDTPTGKRNNFESSVALLLPVDPVKSKRKGAKRKEANISGAGAAPLKVSRGTTGVELRYYTPTEYRALSEEQQSELRELRKGSKHKSPAKKGGNKFSPGKGSKKTFRREVASVLKSLQDEADQKVAKRTEEISSIKAILSEMVGGPSADDTTSAPAAKKAKIASANVADAYTREVDAAEIAAVKLKGVLEKLTLNDGPAKGKKSGGR